MSRKGAKRTSYWRQKLYRRQIMRGARCIRCHYCGTPLTPVTVTIDHVRPRAKGGKWRLSNLVLACAKCNNAKGDMSVQEFMQAQKQAA